MTPAEYENRKKYQAIAAAKAAIRDRSEKVYTEDEITELATLAAEAVASRYRLEDRTFDDFRFGYELSALFRSPAVNSVSGLSVATREIIRSMGWQLVPLTPTLPAFVSDAVPDGTIIAGDADYIRRKLAGDPTVDADYPTPPVVSVTVNSYGDDYDGGD
jgi:hypothetical protein